MDVWKTSSHTPRSPLRVTIVCVKYSSPARDWSMPTTRRAKATSVSAASAGRTARRKLAGMRGARAGEHALPREQRPPAHRLGLRRHEPAEAAAPPRRAMAGRRAEPRHVAAAREVARPEERLVRDGEEEVAAGHPCQLPEDRGGVGQVLEHLGADDEVELAVVERERAQVRRHPGGAGIAPPEYLDRLRPPVHPGERAVRQRGREPAGDVPLAAPGVQDAARGERDDLVEEAPAEAPEEPALDPAGALVLLRVVRPLPEAVVATGGHARIVTAPVAAPRRLLSRPMSPTSAPNVAAAGTPERLDHVELSVVIP